MKGFLFLNLVWMFSMGIFLSLNLAMAGVDSRYLNNSDLEWKGSGTPSVREDARLNYSVDPTPSGWTWIRQNKAKDFFASALPLTATGDRPRYSYARIKEYAKDGTPEYEIATLNLESDGRVHRAVECKRSTVAESLEAMEPSSWGSYVKAWVGVKDHKYECYYASRNKCRALYRNLEKHAGDLAKCESIATELEEILEYESQPQPNTKTYFQALRSEMGALKAFIQDAGAPSLSRNDIQAAMARKIPEEHFRKKMFYSMMLFQDLQNNLEVCNKFFPTTDGKKVLDKVKATKPEKATKANQ